MPPVPVVPPEVVVPPEALPPVPMVVPPLEQPTASRSAIAGPRTELNDDTVRSTDDDVMSTPLNVRCGKHQNRTPGQLQRRYHLRHQQRVRLRLPARQH